MHIVTIYKLLTKISIFLLFLTLCLTFYYRRKNRNIKDFGKIIAVLMIFSLTAASTICLKSKKKWEIKPKKQANYSAIYPQLNKKEGIYGKIAICMYYTKEVESYSAITAEINEKYAQLHGYDFVIEKKSLSHKRAPQWEKLNVVKSCLDARDMHGNRKYDYVFWIDSDAFINRQDITLENYIVPNKDFIVCEDDQSNLFNTGTFFIKNNQWGNEFIDLWWKLGENSHFETNYFHEQDILESMYKSDMLGLRKKISIKSSTSFNSFGLDVFGEDCKWEKTFIIHMMGRTHQKRIEYLSKIRHNFLNN